MKLKSVKSKFIGSYVALLILFLIQMPIIYMFVSSMNEKYPQADAAGALRKRAFEIMEILSRHIMTGNEDLEKVFHEKITEYDASIESIRNGSNSLHAITDKDILLKLDSVDKEWKETKATLNKAMEDGDKLRVFEKRVKDTTQPMVEKVTSLITAYYDLKDMSYNKNVELTAQRRMMTVKMSYIMERYFLSESEKQEVAEELGVAVSFFQEGLDALKAGSPAIGIRPPKGEKILRALDDMEKGWEERKSIIATAVTAKDDFSAHYSALMQTRLPQLVSAANELTKAISASAKSKARNAMLTLTLSISASIAIGVFFMRSTHGILADVTARIATSSNTLASASDQLSASSAQISKGADKQADQTSQVATAMEEMNATVVEVATNSNRASESAKGAQANAVNGGAVIRKAIDAIKEVAAATSSNAETIKKLGKSSEKIGTIVSVIDDIADQTNLLALNAAIEAARAGEQGRGFAVVADEVRKLAERTTKATKEISDMTQAIQNETATAVGAMAEGTSKAENGVKLAHEAGGALENIVKGAQHVTDIITQIATATEQQSATADEIARNMSAITEVAKINGGETKEVVKTTEEIARHAVELKEIVSLL